MKLRILAILTALLCFATLLVGCDKDVPPCETHVDADKNAICDGCKRAVITIVEELPYEEPVVDMVVKPIPTDKVLTDYVSSEPEYQIPVLSGTLTEVEKPEGDIQDTAEGDRYCYIYNFVAEENELTLITEYTKTYTVWDSYTDKTLFTATVEYDENDYDVAAYDVTLGYGFFIVHYHAWEDMEGYVNEYTYYNYAGDEIYTSETEMYDINDYDYAVNYWYFAEETLAIDTETYTVIYQDAANTFVERPVFDYTTENYGVCEVNGKYLVYDLNKWIDCVYAYTLPSTYENVSVWAIAEDKLLVQAFEPLMASSINFDVEVDGAKYDIRYTVIDLATKTAAEKEFGYVIGDVSLDFSGMTENVKTLVLVNEIADKKVDENKEHVFAIDANLDIVFAYEPMHLAQDGYALIPVGNGLFLATLKFADNTEVEVIMDKDGFKNYLPRDYEVTLGMLEIDGVFYDFTLQEVYDYAENGFVIYKKTEDFIIFAKEEMVEENIETRYYFYNGVEAPALIEENYYEINTYGYVTTKTVTVDEVDTTVYTLYNANNEVVGEFEAEPNVFCLDGEEGLFAVSTSDGKAYLVK